MKLSKLQKFILVVGVQIILILGIILMRLLVFQGATDVLLKINPIDPRDPLRGDYITFTYEIGSVEQYEVDDISEFEKGDRVYTILGKRTEYQPISDLGDDLGRIKVSYVKKVQKQKPADSQLFIEGTVKNVIKNTDLEPGADLSRPIPARPFGGTSLVIEYGIEEYFIPEGTGQNLGWDNTENMYAHVKVTAQGRAQLVQIYKDGEQWPSARMLKGN